MTSEKRRIRLAKMVDEHVGRFLTAILDRWPVRPRAAAKPVIPERILFIKFWGMGSVVLTEPALRWIRRTHPQARIHYLTLARNRALLEMIPHVAHIHTIRFRSLKDFLTTSARTLRRLRQQRFDLILDAEFFCNFSGLMARVAAPAGVVAGFSRPGGGKGGIHDICTAFQSDRHVSLQFLGLAQAGTGWAGEAAEEKRGWLRPRLSGGPGPVSHRVAALQAQPAPYVVVNVNASPLAFERRWPRQSFVHLCTALLEEHDFRLVLTGSGPEAPYVRQVIDALGPRERVVDLSGRLEIGDLVRLLAGALCLISSDSGPVHLASAVDAPVAVFYGPETPRLYGPLSSRRLVFFTDLWCSPCMSVDNAKTVHCINHQRCMKTITPEAVVSALQPFLRESPASRRGLPSVPAATRNRASMPDHREVATR